jgi:hypothetical protein
MDSFESNDWVFTVFYENGERSRPMVILAGQDAQSLTNDLPQLSAILNQIGVKERQWQLYTQHAEILLLHLPEEPA